MGKSKQKKAKIKAKSVRSVKAAAPTRVRNEQVGLTEKISRLFYSWVKKGTKKHILIHEKYELKQQIGQGTFGLVFLAENVFTSVAVAVKLEHVSIPHPQLKYESKIYEKLGTNVEGFIEVYYYGTYTKFYNALCMELLGPDLDDLYCACNNHFSLKTVLMIAIRVLRLMRHVHGHNVIYRDVKPENFCIGHHYQQKEKIIYIVDFGLSKMYEEKQKIVIDEDYNYLIGTARYMSVNALCGHTQTKRDDLEAVGYMFVYFLYGTLPWMGLSQTNRDHQETQFEKILDMKRDTTVDELCPDCEAIASYLDYTRSLEFNQEPDYDFVLKLMEKEMKKHDYVDDGIYDWTELMGRNYLTGALVVDPDD